MSVSIQPVTCHSCDALLPELAQLLLDGVNAGASISFIQPFTLADATAFWREQVFPALQAEERLLWVAVQNQQVVGAVQLIMSLPPNQAHRCEVAKLMVHSGCRRMGIGRLLMQAVLTTAKLHNKRLITLDTRTGDPSQSLYASIGFEVAGEIPDFALDPDGGQLSGTTYMYQRL